ncbi:MULTISPECIES: PepSY-associated TM helix domain-containing protein [unclassified Acinetobacter]|uniref:PepSY-associated TM helix domain-containing protein n=1 Tax=unclassified Acinetobacter TaxID=196816 RepID=UPI00288119FF|nr:MULTISPECIES: PepSY-associated TM helix domain-containing protein [unclassified Acinetobacter]MDT0198060.1 PepSY-associated TM helix domain-containing protein [Acinetobacter sp. RG5]MDT0229524.1 PepSY-associated TM helix domain-containing protein [Acinetobacter sp. RRD8]
MRVDAKPEGPRQSMSWLHTWASLILGWLLYAIFLTGTLSFFQNEITVWMKPEFHQSVPPKTQIEQTRVALAYLQQHHPHAGSWAIQLPNSRQNTTTLTIRSASEDPRARRGGTRVTIDSATGEVLQARETRGGSFLYRFHFELYGLPRIWARWIVGIATLLMLVAIISGVITHKKIFKDFFTFRPGKGQRSWLDAHNATAVFALPFHIMITFSGLLLLLFTLMPWGVNQIYENRGAFLQDQRKSLVQDNSIQAESREGRSESKERRPQAERENRGERGEMSARGESRRSRDEMQAASPAPLTDLAPILATAEKEWKNNPVGTITIIQPNTLKAEIELRALNGVSVAYRNVYPSLAFNGVTGDLEPDQTTLKTPSIANGIYNVFTTLHEARGVDLALRWLLFMSGVVGTLMIATGLILWCVKRAPQQQKQGYKSFGYRVVEVTNIAAIIGLPIACAAYFYANRFIPADMDMRLNWEIRSFFIVWLLTLLYAMIRTHHQAWLELLLLATAAFALLPIVNFLTGGQAIWNTIMHGQWVITSFDLAMWVLAILFWFSFKKVKNHKGLPSKKAKAALKENQA